MKLLYVWIEKFRNIERQGFVIDNEYLVTVNSPDTETIEYLDSENHSVRFCGTPSGLELFRKIYHREIQINKNEQYKEGVKDSTTIRNITALVGENASGKTSIIECLHMRSDQLHYRNEEQRYYFLVFLDEATNSIVIRSRDVLISGKGVTKLNLPHSKGYEEYIIPLVENSDGTSTLIKDTTNIVSIFQKYRQETEGTHYNVLGMPTMPINLADSDFRNAFAGMFDFFCVFHELGGRDNRLVIYLIDDSREYQGYFTKNEVTSEEYKTYFIYRIANLLFRKLRDFLYHEQPLLMLSGEIIWSPEKDILKKEDVECAEVLSFCNIYFPRKGNTSLVSMHLDTPSRGQISQAISFFRNSTHVHNGKRLYNKYLDALEELFNCLLDADAELFTAYYKLEIPFKDHYKNIIASFWNCLELDDPHRNWCESINVDFEWLSAGEYQIATMFSGLYQRLSEKSEGTENRGLILLLDEPEMHMHPETGRRFISYLERALYEFKKKGLINHCQIIMATHSPFIIRELSNYTNSIALVEKKNSIITVRDFNDLSQLILPRRNSYSFNLVMYKIFGVPTIELHNELYGVLQEVNGRDNIMSNDKEEGMDDWLRKAIPQSELVIRKWITEKGKEHEVILQTYIRHSIHHPNNRKNPQYTENNFRQSVEQMLRLL